MNAFALKLQLILEQIEFIDDQVTDLQETIGLAVNELGFQGSQAGWNAKAAM